MSANTKEKKPLLRRPWVIAVGVIVVIGNALSFFDEDESAKISNNSGTTQERSEVIDDPVANSLVDGAVFEIDSIKARYDESEYAAMIGKPLCDGAICLSIKNYQSFCEKASGVTTDSIYGITMYDSVTKYLIDNASFDGADVTWETFTTTAGERAGRCIVTVSASGMYEGSSRRDSAKAQVHRFTVVDGQVLVSAAYPTYTNYILKE
jgi:hypothetical protein